MEGICCSCGKKFTPILRAPAFIQKNLFTECVEVECRQCQRRRERRSEETLKDVCGVKEK